MNEQLNEFMNVCRLFICKLVFFIVTDGLVTSPEDTADFLSVTDNVTAFHLVFVQCWNGP